MVFMFLIKIPWFSCCYPIWNDSSSNSVNQSGFCFWKTIKVFTSRIYLEYSYTPGTPDTVPAHPAPGPGRPHLPYPTNRPASPRETALGIPPLPGLDPGEKTPVWFPVGHPRP